MATTKKTTKKKTAPTVKPEPAPEAPEDAQAPAIPDFPDEAIGDDVPEIQIGDDTTTDEAPNASAAVVLPSGFEVAVDPDYKGAIIPIPIGKTPTGHVARHTELRMSREQALGWRLLLNGLDEKHLRLANGKVVQKLPDAIRWIGEQVIVSGAHAPHLLRDAATTTEPKES